MNSLDKANRKRRVAVLMGGTSSERPISLSTGKMILSALDAAKYEVTAIDTRDLLALPRSSFALLPEREERREGEPEESYVHSMRPEENQPEGNQPEGNQPKENQSEENQSEDIQPEENQSEENHAIARRSAEKANQGGDVDDWERGLGVTKEVPDVVFIALHGKGGEDGTIQGVLELLGLPYTGSGVLASALAMDKRMSKRLFEDAGIPVVDGLEVKRECRSQEGSRLQEGLDAEAFRRSILPEVEARLGFPVFVKPNAEGSTFGCTLVTSPETLIAAILHAHRYDDMALIEKYLRGTEITVGVLETRGALQSLPVIEIVPRAAFYDYESKYADGGSEHIIPARLSEALTRQAQEIAERCHTLLGCRGMSRTDMIVVDDQIFVLELNTIPGMTPTSLLPQAAAHAGIPFPVLLDRLIQSALDR